jgi:uncharacterized membrane protein YagU involved in acid resistance
MNNKNIQAIIGGIAGTAIITLAMFLLSLAGMPDINYGGLLAQFTNTSVIIGWIMHFMVGIALAFLYVYYFREFLPGPYWAKGMIFGVLPWVLTLIMLFPMVDTLDISAETQSPGIFIISTMVAYLAFGAVMALVAHPQGEKGIESFHVPASGH